jgi:bifunctional DNA-binding transcriptional regulator/antitoxin component of YhaV-PrlF toxin-antitoxin module
MADVRSYLTGVKTTVSSKGQIVLPIELRQRDRIEVGQEFEVVRLERGDYRLTRRPGHAASAVVDWLLDCPAKGYFVAITSESTDTV